MIRINLALQGGGAHGAFTWGVLDRLLDDAGLEVAAISGTSAGALNAAAFKAGWARGGRDGARAALADLWRDAGAVTDPALNTWMAAVSPSAAVLARVLEASPLWLGFDALSRALSPQVMGAMLQNPLAQIIARFAPEDICHPGGPALFICATNVRTGKIRVFSGDQVTTGAILASACLPTLFRTVEIEDPATGRVEGYWDGGYAGNPALFPLYAPGLPDDVVIVSLNPQRREALPEDGQAVLNRLNEISFNASLLAELRAIAFVKRLISQGTIAKGAMKDVMVHMIADDALMNDLNVATKTIAVPVILARLREAGRAAADGFLARHRGDLGRRCTLDLAAVLA